MTKLEAPEEILQCVGYYGFGGGWIGGRLLQRGVTPSGESYCVSCPLQLQCWNKHEERIRSMFPSTGDLINKLSAETGLRGMELHAEFERRFKARSPALAVMAGNIEDGLAVGSGGFPADRQRFTLPYPFRAEQRA